ncbi:MAG: hypothetical protein EXR07_17205 [Acetobacteraceae bacterium]|nr:hypothetical protein [Acetobacteraceae bacterium]
MIGFAWNALREAVYGAQADRLLLVHYETLTANPLGTLTAIHDIVGAALFPHDPALIEPVHEAIALDMRLGTPGLHAVGSRVRAEKRPTILPPDLSTRFERDAFWEDPANLPPAAWVL